MRDRAGVDALAEPLRAALADESAAVRIAAGEALGRFGETADAERALAVLLDHANAEKGDIFRAMASLNAIDYMDERARSALDRIAALPTTDPKAARKFSAYLPNLIRKIQADLE